MASISGFWHGAAALTGRIDLSSAIHHGAPLESLNDTDLHQHGVHTRHIKRLRNAPPLDDVGNHIVINEEPYPQRLALLPFAPPLLFFRGNIARLMEPTVAIVGARKCTQRGREMATTLAKALTSHELCICSGLAYGIDEAAQLAVPGRTVAVLGQGWSSPMTRRLRYCVDQIIDEGGLIVTEFLPQIPPNRHTFPLRNRVISGLSMATIVVEASARSGSQITARNALEQGREVMAVPGHPHDPMSAGCNSLIAQGAALIQGPADALEVLGIHRQERQLPTIQCRTQQHVLQSLKTGQTLDHIANQTGETVPALIVAIQALELTGHLVRLPGDRYSLTESP